MNNGDKIKITYLPPCRNGMGSRNPYIEMEGEVRDFDGNVFSLYTGHSWLTCIHLKTCKYDTI